MHIHTLSDAECVRLLSDNRLAHLACAKDGRPYVVPIYFAYADNHLYAFSLPGRKIDFMRTNPEVSLIVEEPGNGREWKSVVVEGQFEELPDRIGHKRERDYARSLLRKHANWWEPGALKPVATPLYNYSEPIFFRVLVKRLSGREAKQT